MKTVIFFYTGTGNSLWCARVLAHALGETELMPMPRITSDVVIVDADCVGFVFPVHMWGVPGAVLNFIRRLHPDPAKYYFALAVNAGQVSATLLQLQDFMAGCRMKLSAGFSLVLPSNYIPWGGPGSLAEVQKKIQQAGGRIQDSIVPILRKRSVQPVDEGPLWQRIIFTWIYKLTFSRISAMDKDFWVDAKCNACGICEKICPARNIRMQQGKPIWKHVCEQCLACIQWCPQAAIQYGKKTPLYPRYHHPEVKVTDIIKSAPAE